LPAAGTCGREERQARLHDPESRRLLWIGNYEFDLADGELRFKTSVDAGDNPAGLTNEMVERLA
jgi:hypothetical protein